MYVHASYVCVPAEVSIEFLRGRVIGGCEPLNISG